MGPKRGMALRGVSGAQGVKLLSAAGDVDLTGYDVGLFDDPLNNGTDVCFDNASILIGQTVLLNVKAKLQNSLSEVGIATSPFTFSGSLREAGTSCTGNLETLANPNPVSADLGFTTSYIGSSGSGGSAKK